MNRNLKIYASGFAAFMLPVILTACANIGNPTGGARDEDPPLFVSASPAPGSLNVDRDRIVINFNELVNVKDAFNKVVVSPTSKQVPKVTSSGRRVTVSFDSLAPNTTYTVDFADAIEDNNEGNKLQGFTYTFSTGPELDTLRISGMVLGARDLEPQQGMIVGVHENLSDSAFTKIPLLRVAKTDDKGQFSIRGLKAGKYRVFALGDKDNDYKYANPEEDIAFYDVVVSPSAERTEANDTLYTPLGEVDTVVVRGRTRFLPNDILLRTFNSEVRPQYLTKYERIDSTRVFLKMNTKSDSLPRFEFIGRPGFSMKDAVLERNATNDSLVYWLPEPMVRTDSLLIATSYLRTDSTGGLSLTSDTLRFFTDRPRPQKKKKKDKEKVVKISAADSIAAITLGAKFISPSTQEIFEPVVMEFDTPLARLDTSAIHLEVMVDTLWRKAPKPLVVSRRDSVSPRHLKMEYPWDYGVKYRITVDTLAATGIYGKPTRPLNHEFTVKKEEDYCSMTFRLSGLEPGVPAFVELLSSADKVVRVVKVKDNTAYFPFLAPAKYYARVIEDFNGNGLYDTGNYDEKRQPDLAYYYPKVINIKKNWDKEESWDVFAMAIDQMKPFAIKKNRPETPKNKRNEQTSGEEEEEDEVFDPTRNPFDPNQKNRRKAGGIQQY